MRDSRLTLDIFTLPPSIRSRSLLSLVLLSRIHLVRTINLFPRPGLLRILPLPLFLILPSLGLMQCVGRQDLCSGLFVCSGILFRLFLFDRLRVRLARASLHLFERAGLLATLWHEE